MDVKSMLLSKTLWLNILAPGFVWLGAQGITLDPDTQAAIVMVLMALANIVMRRFTTTPAAFTAPLVKAPPVSAILALLLCTVLLSACTPKQTAQARAAAPAIVGLVDQVDPAIVAKLDAACPAVLNGMAAAATVAQLAGQPDATVQQIAGDQTVAAATCTPAGKKAAAAKDQQPVTASNSGDTVNFLVNTLLPDALMAAKVGLAIAAVI